MCYGKRFFFKYLDYIIYMESQLGQGLVIGIVVVNNISFITVDSRAVSRQHS